MAFVANSKTNIGTTDLPKAAAGTGPTMSKSKKRIAMVTGSSSGIGKAIALKLATAGFHVIIHGRGESEHSRQAVSCVEELEVESTAIYADFSSGADWNAFVNKAWQWKGHIDVWVNNAGGDVLTGSWAQRSFEDRLDYLLGADVKSTLMLSRAVGEKMVAGGGNSGAYSIINIGWDQAAQGMAGDSGELFATTKGAVMAMTRSLAQSLAPAVRVNCVAPGWIKTKWGDEASDAWQQRAKSESLMQRWGLPEDVADAVAFLASGESEFISGQIIPVNGGFSHGHPS